MFLCTVLSSGVWDQDELDLRNSLKKVAYADSELPGQRMSGLLPNFGQTLLLKKFQSSRRGNREEIGIHNLFFQLSSFNKRAIVNDKFL